MTAMENGPKLIPLAYAESKVSPGLRTRLVALLLLWATAVVTLLFWS